MPDVRTLGAVLGVGSPTGSIFQLTMADLADGATGQQPAANPATLVKSLPLPNAFPFEINMLSTMSFPKMSRTHRCTFISNHQTRPVTDFPESLYAPGDCVSKMRAFLRVFKLIDCGQDTE